MKKDVILNCNIRTFSYFSLRVFPLNMLRCFVYIIYLKGNPALEKKRRRETREGERGEETRIPGRLSVSVRKKERWCIREILSVFTALLLFLCV